MDIINIETGKRVERQERAAKPDLSDLHGHLSLSPPKIISLKESKNTHTTLAITDRAARLGRVCSTPHVKQYAPMFYMYCKTLATRCYVAGRLSCR